MPLNMLSPSDLLQRAVSHGGSLPQKTVIYFSLDMKLAEI